MQTPMQRPWQAESPKRLPNDAIPHDSFSLSRPLQAAAPAGAPYGSSPQVERTPAQPPFYRKGAVSGDQDSDPHAPAVPPSGRFRCSRWTLGDPIIDGRPFREWILGSTRVHRWHPRRDEPTVWLVVTGCTGEGHSAELEFVSARDAFAFAALSPFGEQQAARDALRDRVREEMRTDKNAWRKPHPAGCMRAWYPAEVRP